MRKEGQIFLAEFPRSQVTIELGIAIEASLHNKNGYRHLALIKGAF
jgi:hypothetical protein